MSNFLKNIDRIGRSHSLKAVYRNHNIIFFVLLLSFLLIFSLGLTGQEKNQAGEVQDVVAKVDDKIITLNDFNQYWGAIPEEYREQLNKKDILDQIIMQTLLIQKADEIGLEEDPEVNFQIKNATEQILIQSLIEKEIIEKTDLTDDEIRSYYEENKETFWNEEEVHAFNILTETEEEAIDVINKLNEGRDFSSLAKEVSIASSAPYGGDLGLIGKGFLITEIEEELFTLNPGEISKIISTDKGFHIFKVIEKNPPHYTELDEIKEVIKQQLLPQKQQLAFDQYLKDIESNATIEKHLELISDNVSE